jgi:hypothetical protein
MSWLNRLVGAGGSGLSCPVRARDLLSCYPVGARDSLSYWLVGVGDSLSCCPVEAGCSSN